MAIRRLLHSRGLRYRVDYRPGKFTRSRADIAFTRQRIAVFVDGCFWHGCPAHRTLPVSNAGYWTPKLARNIERDREANALLASNGWRVLRFWEHENVDSVVERIVRAVREGEADSTSCSE